MRKTILLFFLSTALLLFVSIPQNKIKIQKRANAAVSEIIPVAKYVDTLTSLSFGSGYGPLLGTSGQFYIPHTMELQFQITYRTYFMGTPSCMGLAVANTVDGVKEIVDNDLNGCGSGGHTYTKKVSRKVGPGVHTYDFMYSLRHNDGPPGVPFIVEVVEIRIEAAEEEFPICMFYNATTSIDFSSPLFKDLVATDHNFRLDQKQNVEFEIEYVTDFSGTPSCMGHEFRILLNNAPFTVYNDKYGCGIAGKLYKQKFSVELPAGLYSFIYQGRVTLNSGPPSAYNIVVKKVFIH